jgi:membrane-bound serine protease (ClpP class)
VRTLGILLAVLLLSTGQANAAPRVMVLDLQDTIQPASLRYLERGLREAAAQDVQLVIIELDTPGGLLESTRLMTSAILASRVPVVVYVTPAGARAASAGFFLLLAADVSAMAPGTNTGAAHPVTLGARPEHPKDGEGMPDPSVDKAVKDAAALARALAERRGRSVEAAERAIVESASYTAEEARERGLIDVVAVGREQLLVALDGRELTRFDGERHTLELRDAAVVPFERTFAERVLTVIASPQVAYLLLMLGVMALLIEVMNPGLIVPGVAGGLAMLLGFYGLSVLPVNVVGALLIAVGLALVVVELFVTSYGLLAGAGIAAFVGGSLMLVDTPVPQFQIGPEVIVPVAIVLALVTAVLAIRGTRSRRSRPQSGVEAMIGERGKVVAQIQHDHAGKVFVHGELWDAIAAHALPIGAIVRVDAVDGLTLRVSLQGGKP